VLCALLAWLGLTLAVTADLPTIRP